MNKTLKLRGSEVLVTKGFATCDFCQAQGVECVRSPGIEINAFETERKHVAVLNVWHHYKPAIFGEGYYKVRKDETDHLNIVTGYTKKTIYPDICGDCAKQVAALLKK